MSVTHNVNAWRRLLIGLLLLPLTLAGCLIPRDREIAAQLENKLRSQLHPMSASVTLHRASTFSTHVRSLDISMSGFDADNLMPAGAHTDAKVAAAEPPAVPPANPPTVPLVNPPANSSDNPPTVPPANPPTVQPANPSVVPPSAPSVVPPKKSHGLHVQIDNAHLRCTDFTVQKLPVQELDVTLHNIRVPVEHLNEGFTITSTEPASGYVVFNEAGLTAFLRTCALPLDNPNVQLTTEGCTVSGDYHYTVHSPFKMELKLPVQVSGRIAVRDGSVLYLDHPTLNVASMSLPRGYADALMQKINPLIDLKKGLKLPFTFVIDKTEHAQGTLRFDATLQLPTTEAP